MSNEQKSLRRSLKPFLAVAGVMMALTFSVSGWAYLSGHRMLRVQARQLTATPTPLQPALGNELAGTASATQSVRGSESIDALLGNVEEWARRVTIASAATGLGVTGAAFLGILLWQRRQNAAAKEREEAGPEESPLVKQLRIDLTAQAAERRRAENELSEVRLTIDRRVEERTATLSRTYSRLEAELNERKQAEKAFAQKRQELERSKDVLELHVQARTQELQKLQRRNEHILNSAGEGIYGLDLQGKTTFVNPAAAKLTGWKVDELVGKLEHEVFHRVPPTRSGTAFIGKNGDSLTEQVFYRRDGTSFLVEYVRTPILENGKQMGAVVIFKDITERKRTEEALARKAAELARSNGELEQFAYVASHDLQEPLRKIRAFGDRLKDKVESGKAAEGRDYMERMQNAAARMQTLINDLLTFSRVISATQPFVPVDLAAVTREVLGDLEVRIEQTKAKVEVGELPTIDADPMQMRQLLQNVIGNALKFQTPGTAPVVKIAAKVMKEPFANAAEPTPGDEICEITIQDNGIGFDEKYIDKIFAMFQRLHGRSEYEGTGVGLAVCRRITDRHGGTISAKSKPGEGATFIIHLPVRQAKKETST
ncbi:MAG: ATP-binding protein [Phycisphaerales bacterium]|nr:ATP-binding protein [Phycisphaerales bacterium]